MEITKPINIMTLVVDDQHNKFFIDCPVYIEVEGTELRRIEVPFALAKYITHLQSENDRLEEKVIKLQSPKSKSLFKFY